MSIRDEKLNWKPEALTASQDIEKVLLPILANVLEAGMTLEDFHYLVSDASQTLILKRDRYEKSKTRGLTLYD